MIYTMLDNRDQALKFYEMALQYLNKSLFLRKKNNQAIEGANHYFNLGTCYMKLNRQDSALVFFQEALKTSRESNELFINFLPCF